MFRRRIITRNSKKPLFLSLLPSLQEAHNYNNSNSNNSTSTTILLNHSYYNTYNNSNNSDSPFQKSSDRSLPRVRAVTYHLSQNSGNGELKVAREKKTESGGRGDLA